MARDMPHVILQHVNLLEADSLCFNSSAHERNAFLGCLKVRFDAKPRISPQNPKSKTLNPERKPWTSRALQAPLRARRQAWDLPRCFAKFQGLGSGAGAGVPLSLSALFVLLAQTSFFGHATAPYITILEPAA